MAVMTERPMRMTRGHGGRIPACLRKRARELPSSRNTYVEDGLKLVDEVGELGDSAVVVFAEVSDCESLGMCRSPNGSEGGGCTGGVQGSGDGEAGLGGGASGVGGGECGLGGGRAGHG